MARKAAISREDFIEAWQAAESCAQARKKLGKFASVRAAKLRADGVKLKKFPRGRPKKDK